LTMFAFAAAVLGCAQPPQIPSHTQDDRRWSGRLALQVQASQDPHAPGAAPQSFSAAFTLQGSSAQGQLLLFTPLGSTLARLHWQRGQATLEQGQTHKTAPTLAELVAEITGSPLPVDAFFDWLQGRAHAAAGWQVDLSRQPQGRIRAWRQQHPQATLRLVLDQEGA